MAREVRITVDDDEVFERMKARKQDLDLSWEEVLHRGLRETPEPPEPPEPPDSPDLPGVPSGSDGGSERGESRRERGRGRERRRDRGRDRGGESIGDVVDQFRSQLRDQVRESVRESMESSLGTDLDREVTELEAAEDAVLRFPFLDDEGPAYRVPLRVDMQTSRDGLAVDVVAVRQGKSVRDMNRFDRAARRAVNERLARGDTATLEFEAAGGENSAEPSVAAAPEDGAESYAVAPVLSWTQGDDGGPAVGAVEVDEVLFDDDD